MDYRSMVNPTFLTARTTLYMLASAGNEDAAQIIASLGTKDDLVNNSRTKEQKSPLSPEDMKAVMTGATLAVEARYASLSSYLRKEGYKRLLDIACGYTPRAIYCDREGIDYVGIDVPVVAEELQAMIKEMGLGKNHDPTWAAMPPMPPPLRPAQIFYQESSSSPARDFWDTCRQMSFSS